jgi:hypothetical protein
MAPPGGNDWDQWQKHVLAELHRFNDWLKDLTREQQKIRTNIATLNVKAGAWGLLGGVAAVLALVAVEFLKG